MLGEVTLGFFTNTLNDLARIGINFFAPAPPPPLRAALLEAWRTACDRLATLPHEDSDFKALIVQAGHEGERLILPGEPARGSLIDALVSGDFMAVEAAIRIGLSDILVHETQADPVVRRLTTSFISEVGRTLRRPRHERAWIDYYRLLLLRILDALRTPPAGTTDILARLQEVLARDDAIIKVADAVLATLASLRVEVNQAADQIRDELWHAQQAERERLEELIARLGRDRYQSLANRQTAGYVAALTAAAAAGIQVGRGQEMRLLDDFVSGSHRGGRLLVVAPAGMGKTTLLSHWVSGRDRQGLRTVRHFFSQRDHGGHIAKLGNASRNLAQQILAAQGLVDQPLPADENALGEIVYGLVEDWSPTEHGPLVIVLDALDEAEGPFMVLPDQLPDGVFLILSARGQADALPADLAGYARDARVMPLRPLSHAAVAEYLARSATYWLRTLASNAAIVEHIAERTQGLPIFLSYLTDELEEATASATSPTDAEAIVNEIISSTPTGLVAYVAAEITRLSAAVDGQMPRARDLLALLAVALDPLSSVAIWILTGLDPQALPWRLTRWLGRAEDPGGAQGYVFAHPLLAEAFTQALTPYLPHARRMLLDFCRDWPRHHDAYALTHLADHLTEAGELEALWEATRSEELRAAQRTRVADVTVPIRMLRGALQTALSAGLAGQAAELLILHAYEASLLRSSSPLEHLRAGRPQSALITAGLHTPRIRTLWLLLMSLYRHVAGDKEAGLALLDNLQQERLPLLGEAKEDDNPVSFMPDRSWREDLAVALLVRLATFDPAKVATLALRLLTEPMLRRLVGMLADAGRRECLHMMRQMSSDSELVALLSHLLGEEPQMTDFDRDTVRALWSWLADHYAEERPELASTCFLRAMDCLRADDELETLSDMARLEARVSTTTMALDLLRQAVPQAGERPMGVVLTLIARGETDISDDAIDVCLKQITDDPDTQWQPVMLSALVRAAGSHPAALGKVLATLRARAARLPIENRGEYILKFLELTDPPAGTDPLRQFQSLMNGSTDVSGLSGPVGTDRPHGLDSPRQAARMGALMLTHDRAQGEMLIRTAAQDLSQQPETFWDPSTIQAVASALADAGNHGEALALIRDALDDDTISGEDRDTLLETKAHCLLAAGRPGDLLDVYAQMSNMQKRTDHLLSFATGDSLAADVDVFARAIPRSQFEWAGYSLFQQLCRWISRLKGAGTDTIRPLILVATERDSESAWSHMWDMGLAAGLAGAHDIAAALLDATYEKIAALAEASLRAAIFRNLLRLHLRRVSTGEVPVLPDDQMASAEIEPVVSNLARAIAYHWGGRPARYADAHFSRAFREALSLADDHARRVGLERVATHVALTNRHVMADLIWRRRRAMQEGEDAWSWRRMASHMAWCGWADDEEVAVMPSSPMPAAAALARVPHDVGTALRYASFIDAPAEHSRVLAEIAVRTLMAGKDHEGREVLRLALDALKDVEDAAGRGRARLHLVSAIARAEGTAPAVAALRQALQELESVQCWPPPRSRGQWIF